MYLADRKWGQVTSCFWMELLPFYKVLFSFRYKGIMFLYLINIYFTKLDQRFSCYRINNNSLKEKPVMCCLLYFNYL